MRRMRHKYKPGNNKAICDICGWVHYASDLRYNSDGLLVCARDWEPEHPLDKAYPGRVEKIVPDKVRVEPDDVFVDVQHGSFPFEFPFNLS